MGLVCSAVSKKNCFSLRVAFLSVYCVYCVNMLCIICRIACLLSPRLSPRSVAIWIIQSSSLILFMTKWCVD